MGGGLPPGAAVPRVLRPGRGRVGDIRVASVAQSLGPICREGGAEVWVRVPHPHGQPGLGWGGGLRGRGSLTHSISPGVRRGRGRGDPSPPGQPGAEEESGAGGPSPPEASWAGEGAQGQGSLSPGDGEGPKAPRWVGGTGWGSLTPRDVLMGDSLKRTLLHSSGQTPRSSSGLICSSSCPCSTPKLRTVLREGGHG